MKKVSIISIVVFFAMITFMAFSSINAKNTSPEGPKSQILVHVIGCDDCKSITVCLNGHLSYTFYTSDFYITCEDSQDAQEICVTCCNGSGSVIVLCDQGEVKIEVDASGTACPCDGSRTKKK
jgi:hypothetical protein